MSDQKYAPKEIPATVEVTVFTHYGLQGHHMGQLIHYAFEASGENYVCLTKTPVTVHIPKQDDLKEKVVAALEAEKKKQMAEHHKKMFEIQEKIDSLLQLEYKPAAFEDMAVENDLPF